MTDSIAWPQSAKHFRVVCRLGTLSADGPDPDTYADLAAQGGIVELEASIDRARYIEPDGRMRMLSLPRQTYQIQAQTGELIDANGSVGVWLLDTSTPGLDPQEWTYRALVRPNVGERWEVTFPGVVPPGVLDLASVEDIEASGGSSTLASRVALLEGRVTAIEADNGTGAPVAWDTITGKPSVFPPQPDGVRDIVGSMVSAAGGTYSDGQITLPTPPELTTVPLSALTPGTRITALWSGTAWEYPVGQPLTGRPALPAGCYLDLVGAPASTPDPAWLMTGDGRLDI